MQIMRHRLTWISLMMLYGNQAPAQTARYGLDAYLNDVNAMHDGIKASQESVLAAQAKRAEADVPYAWTAFATVQGMVDKRETANQAIQGDTTRQESLAAGVSKLWTEGTQTKVYYNIANTHISGANPLMMPSDHFVTAGPTVEVSQPLWRNAGGSELQAARDLTVAQTTVAELQESFKTKVTLQASELAYWRLVLAREARVAQKQSLERFRKLRAWNAKRVDDALADRADLLQADAAVKGKQLELRLAEDEERAASRDFNLGRGRDSDEVPETLQTIDDTLVAAIKPPEYRKARADVEAAKEAARLADAAARLNREKYAPSLDLFGTASLNGRDESLGKSTQESFQTSHPQVVVGLKLSAPLDRELLDRAKSGYERDKMAAELNAKRRDMEASIQYKDLLAQFEGARSRFTLAEAIESAQKQKLEHERERHRVGRTTTYQVLLFEQDFASSQMARIRSQADIMRISAQLKTFGG